jgi:hypothetical protein
MNTKPEELGLSPELVEKLVQASREAAARAKAKAGLTGSNSGQTMGRKCFPLRFLAPGHVQIKLEALKRLAVDTHNIPLLVLVRCEEIWASPQGRAATKLGPFEIGGIAVSEGEKTQGLAALRKAGLIQ